MRISGTSMKLLVFGRLYIPDHGFGKRGSQCKGGKKVKQRVTIALIANADGEKEAAIVIWKSENPRCFKGIVGATFLYNILVSRKGG